MQNTNRLSNSLIFIYNSSKTPLQTAQPGVVLLWLFTNFYLFIDHASIDDDEYDDDVGDDDDDDDASKHHWNSRTRVAIKLVRRNDAQTLPLIHVVERRPKLY